MTGRNRAHMFLISLAALALLSSLIIVHAQDAENYTEYDASDSSAAETTSDGLVYEDVAGETISKNLAYSWLYETVKGNWPKNIEDNAFALLALTSDSDMREDGKKALLDKKSGSAWTTIKNSALAMLALNNMGEDTDDAESWLLEQEEPFRARSLEWRIQLDYSDTTSCEISYGGKTDKVEVNYDGYGNLKLEINGNPKCLRLTDDNLWIKIDSSLDDGVCIDPRETKYAISCDDSIKSSLFYKKDSTFFIPSKTESGSYTELKIESVCLADRGICDYESNLWAAYALSKVGSDDVNTLFPYLISQEEVEEDTMPSAFLYMLTENDDKAKKLLGLQEPKGFWYSKDYGKWYSTALAYMSLNNYYGAQENLTGAKRYIIDHQSREGHWDNNLRDTAFLFYAMWPSYYAGTKDKDKDNLCVQNKYDCKEICDSEDEVEVKEFSYYCGDDQCCKKKESSPDCIKTENCLDYDCDMFTLPNGCTCEYNRERSCDDKCDNDGDGLIDEKDEDCKISECVAKGYKCCETCESGHKSQYDSSCESGECCEKCFESEEICDDGEDNDDDGYLDCDDPECELDDECQKSSILWFIIPGVIIIVLMGAYVYFNKTKGFNLFDWFNKQILKFKKPKFKQTSSAPQMQPRYAVRVGQPAYGQQAMPGSSRHIMRTSRPTRPEESETETELEKTMKKIKEMSKKK